MPKVSICIPTYNRKHLLKETLESVFAQSYKDFEVVIVDDGSTDGTKQMIENCGFDVRYYWQKNSGDAEARNRLIQLADGEYISFLDSDDLLFVDSIKKMVAAVPNERNDVIIYGPYVAINSQGDVLARKQKKLYSGKITTQLFENILVHSCGSMFPKKALVEAGGFDTSLKVCSDYDLWLRLSLQYDFIAITQPLFKRRRHAGNLSQLCFTNRNIEFKVLENFYNEKGGKNIIDKKCAMTRLAKEQYRAARSALREGKTEIAKKYFAQSIEKNYSFKSAMWLSVAKTKKQRKKPNTFSDIKIIFDFDPVVANKYSGFYSFGTGLLTGFSKLKEIPQLKLFCARKNKKYIKKIAAQFNVPTEIKTTSVKLRWLEKYWQYFNWPKLSLFAGNCDLYHSFHHLMPPISGAIKLMTVHDLRRYKLPHLYEKSKLEPFENAVKRADHFIAVSESTKQDLCKIFDVPQNKVDVLHLASSIEPVFYSQEKRKQFKENLSKTFGCKIDEYFTVISSPDSRKNISRTIEAFQKASSSIKPNTVLLVIGNLDKHNIELSNKLKSEYYKNVFCTGAVDDLRPYLACCRAMLFASLYEGFGIPILEAFACGAAVITSNCSSMPEVAADAAMYVDPLSIDSIAKAITEIANDDVLRNELILAGAERNEMFSWKLTAERLMEIYKELIC